VLPLLEVGGRWASHLLLVRVAHVGRRGGRGAVLRRRLLLALLRRVPLLAHAQRGRSLSQARPTITYGLERSGMDRISVGIGMGPAVHRLSSGAALAHLLRRRRGRAVCLRGRRGRRVVRHVHGGGGDVGHSHGGGGRGADLPGRRGEERVGLEPHVRRVARRQQPLRLRPVALALGVLPVREG
jgi:hypothetical protein